MRVISKKRLREFWNEHPEAETPLKRWYKLSHHAQWSSLQDVRRTFPHADGVKLKGKATATIFNVSKTGYRVITQINYEFGRVYVRQVLTHDEYMKAEWKKTL